MRILRALGFAVGSLLALGLALTLAARLTDGGFAVLPGGPLESGELASGPEPGGDWSFARDIREMTFQLVEPAQSRTVWLLVHDGRLFVASGYMKSPIGRLWKRWPAKAERDGRSVIRIEGKRYERRAVRIHERSVFEALSAETERKYGVAISADDTVAGETWVFELLPR
ncbi:MAG: hypothetical protein JRG83_15565 [Deltaproteobacteria bacterium]|nr:hypothetical protein [Deltaproteobacteria bacterium]